MNRSFIYFFITLSFLVVFLANLPCTFASKDKATIVDHPRKVLFLSSHHSSFQWTDSILKKIKDAFLDQNIELTTDFLDTERQFGSKYKNAILNLLAIKYSNTHYDLIITCGNNASQFFITHGRRVFPDTPHIFCGVTAMNSDMIQDRTPGTGITAQMNVYRNLQLIARLHPDCKKIVLIADNSSDGKAIQSQVNQIYHYSKPDIPIEIWNDFSIKKLKEKLIRIHNDTIILYGIFYRDKDGVFMETGDLILPLVQELWGDI